MKKVKNRGGEGEVAKVKLIMGGKRMAAHSCKLCSASFISEFELILHFHGKHLIPHRRNLLLEREKGVKTADGSLRGLEALEDDLGTGTDLEDLDDDEEDDLKIESESQSDVEDGNGQTSKLDFLTDIEKALLGNPTLFPLFGQFDEEDEIETDWAPEVKYEELSQPQWEIESSETEQEPTKETLNGTVVGSTSVRRHLSQICPEECSSSKLISSRRKSSSPRKRNKMGCFTSPKRYLGLSPLITSATQSSGKAQSSVYGLKPQSCIFCSKELADPDLWDHIRSHIREEPYFCGMCDYSFATEERCAAHMQKRHPKRHPPRYKCKRCDEAFLTGAMLKKHMLHHVAVKKYRARKQFGCRTCDKRYKHLRVFIRHLSRTPGHKMLPISRWKKLRTRSRNTLSG